MKAYNAHRIYMHTHTTHTTHTPHHTHHTHTTPHHTRHTHHTHTTPHHTHTHTHTHAHTHTHTHTRWSNLKKRVALSKQRIGPRIQSKEDLITQDLAHFADLFTSLRRRFEHSPCLDHRCPREDVWNLIGEFGRELGELQKQVRDLAELQELLETSVFNFSLLKK